MKNFSFNIINLNCAGCAKTISKSLRKIEGVKEVNVNLETAEVEITAEEVVERTVLKKALAGLGYPEQGDSHNSIHKLKSLYSCVTGKLSKE